MEKSGNGDLSTLSVEISLTLDRFWPEDFALSVGTNGRLTSKSGED